MFYENTNEIQTAHKTSHTSTINETNKTSAIRKITTSAINQQKCNRKYLSYHPYSLYLCSSLPHSKASSFDVAKLRDGFSQ